jgi:Protein of unknown function (DUF3311)
VVRSLQCGTANAGRSGDPVVSSEKDRWLGRAPESRKNVDERMPVMWVLLLLPFVGLLWVPFYNLQEPALFGFPFFYWYQLAWVPITSFLIWLVYRSHKPDDETP